MPLPSWARRLSLFVHILVSVGWIGAVLAYLVLDITVTTSRDANLLRASYAAMGLVTRWAIVPLAYATLATGLVVSLGTKWGLFRHYWVIVSLIMTVLAMVVLLVEANTVYALAEAATDSAMSDDEIRALPGTLFHSIGGTIVLVAVMALNVYKPRGVTGYGWRKLQEATVGDA